MKAFVLSILAILLSITVVYAQETEQDITHISITLEEIKVLTPDVLSMTLEFNVTTKKEAEAVNILGAIDKAIRGLNLKYTGGNYSVYKNCWWEKYTYECSGYKGSNGYVFELKEAKEQNKVIEVLEDFKEKYKDKINYTVSSPEWVVTEKTAKTEESELKLKIIDSAKDFAKKVSEKLGKTCFISTINYDVRRPYFWEPIYLKSLEMAKSAIEAPEPKKEDKTLSVKASVSLRCK